MSLWGARFYKQVDKKVNDFNSSISIDSRMFEQDINGSIAHATMLGECNIIEKSESEKIVKELKEILNDIKSKKLEIDPNAEDIHMFIETELTKRIGESGKRLHSARSRNDQVALDIRMYLKQETMDIIDLLKDLIKILIKKSKENINVVMSGYTHMQRAQPITFSHHLMAYANMFLRDISRLEESYKRINVMPLGAGALAGTTYNIDREMVKDILKFDEVTQNSLDAVSDRDFCIETLSNLSMIMMHLSRFSEEIILWCSWEFKFIELDDAYATGSSIMPQKKNPDVAELVRGKTGRVYGDLIAMLTIMKGLPLAYNKDMQEDKQSVFDGIDTVKLCLKTFAPMIETMKILEKNTREAAGKGFINATDCADYLVKKGLAFRDAYSIVGKIVALCIQKDTVLEKLRLETYKEFSDKFENDIYHSISLEKCVNDRNVIGGPCKQQIQKQIEYIENKL